MCIAPDGDLWIVNGNYCWFFCPFNSRTVLLLTPGELYHPGKDSGNFMYECERKTLCFSNEVVTVYTQYLVRLLLVGVDYCEKLSVSSLQSFYNDVYKVIVSIDNMMYFFLRYS